MLGVRWQGRAGSPARGDTEMQVKPQGKQGGFRRAQEGFNPAAAGSEECGTSGPRSSRPRGSTWLLPTQGTADHRCGAATDLRPLGSRRRVCQGSAPHASPMEKRGPRSGAWARLLAWQLYIASLLPVTVATGFILLKPGPACDAVGKEQLRGDEVLRAGCWGRRLGSVPAATIWDPGAGWAGDALGLGPRSVSLQTASLGTVISLSMTC